MTGVKNVSGIKLTHIANQSDYEHNPEDGEFAFSTSADQLTFYVSGGAAEWLKPKVGGNPYGICLTGESIENYLGGKSLNVTADYAYTAATTLDTFTAKTPNNEYVGEINQLYLSAGKGIDFVSGNDGKLTISSEGTTYTTGQYINISNDNKISVTGTLINSAQSGQSAYNWITAQSATLSAGPGIKFTSAGANTMGITITAGGVGGVITAIAGSALSAGSNYTQGRCIVISGNNNKINLADDISVDTITADRLTNDGDAEAYISINHDLEDFGELYPTKLVLWRTPEGTQASISSMYSNRNISSFSSDGGYNFNSINVSANYINLESQNNGVHFILNMNDHDVSYTYNASTTTADWDSILRNANSNWVSSSPDGITISSNSVVKLVFTPTLPPTLDDNTYYIV
jgi:hypothetical protein